MPQKRKTRKHLPKRKKRFSLGRLRKSENSRKRDGARVTRKNKKGGAVGSVLVGGAVFVTMYPLFLLWSMQKLIGVSHDFGMQMIGSGGALGLSCTAGNFKKHFAVVKGFKFKTLYKEFLDVKTRLGINDGKLCVRVSGSKSFMQFGQHKRNEDVETYAKMGIVLAEKIRALSSVLQTASNVSTVEFIGKCDGEKKHLTKKLTVEDVKKEVAMIKDKRISYCGDSGDVGVDKLSDLRTIQMRLREKREKIEKIIKEIKEIKTHMEKMKTMEGLKKDSSSPLSYERLMENLKELKKELNKGTETIPEFNKLECALFDVYTLGSTYNIRSLRELKILPTPHYSKTIGYGNNKERAETLAEQDRVRKDGVKAGELSGVIATVKKGGRFVSSVPGNIGKGIGGAGQWIGRQVTGNLREPQGLMGMGEDGKWTVLFYRHALWTKGKELKELSETILKNSKTQESQSKHFVKEHSKMGEDSENYFVAPYTMNMQKPTLALHGKTTIPPNIEQLLKKMVLKLDKLHNALELCQRCYIYNQKHARRVPKMFKEWSKQVKLSDGTSVPYYEKLFLMYRNKALELVAVIGSIDEKASATSPLLYESSLVPVNIKLWQNLGICAVKMPNFISNFHKLPKTTSKTKTETKTKPVNSNCLTHDEICDYYKKANTIALERLAVDKLKLIALMPIAPSAPPAVEGAGAEPGAAAPAAEPKAEPASAPAPKAGAGAGKRAGQGAGAGKRVQAGGALPSKDDCNSLLQIEILKKLLKETPDDITIETGIEAVKKLDELLRQGTISEECKQKIKELEHTEINQAIDMIDKIRKQQEQAKMTQQKCSGDSNLECRFKKLDKTYKTQRGDLSFEDSVAGLAEAYADDRKRRKEERISKITELQKMVGPKDPAKKRVESALEKVQEEEEEKAVGEPAGGSYRPMPSPRSPDGGGAEGDRPPPYSLSVPPVPSAPPPPPPTPG